MTFTLGAIPDSMTVSLSQGADFFQTIRTKSGDDWPAGATIELRFADGTIWPANIVDDTAAWDVDKVAVADLITVKPKKVQLYYTDGTFDALWASGPVRVHA